MNLLKNKFICRFKYINRFEYFKNENVFYLQFTIKVFQIYFLISVNEEIFMMINIIFVKHTLLFILGERFFVYLIDVLTGNNFGGS